MIKKEQEQLSLEFAMGRAAVPTGVTVYAEVNIGRANMQLRANLYSKMVGKQCGGAAVQTRVTGQSK